MMITPSKQNCPTQAFPNLKTNSKYENGKKFRHIFTSMIEIIHLLLYSVSTLLITEAEFLITRKEKGEKSNVQPKSHPPDCIGADFNSSRLWRSATDSS
jgi:hypothetical protein